VKAIDLSGIRTVIVTTPAMLRDLIERLARDRVELDIVAEFKARRALARQLAELRPELVVIGMRANETDVVVRDLLAVVPKARFIAFSADGRSANGFELRLYGADLTNLPPGELVDFMRGCGGFDAVARGRI
jgi:DNA-binding NarL/FixJ family response regulator